jgi:hypothetical protein
MAHFIQARKARELPWVGAKVSYLGSDQFQLTLEDGQILIRRNHEPGRLLSYLKLYGQWNVEYQSRHYLLGIQTGPKSTAMFSMGDNPLDSCHDRYVPKKKPAAKVQRVPVTQEDRDLAAKIYPNQKWADYEIEMLKALGHL